MYDQIAKSWNLFIHKNLLNPVNVRKEVFQSWLRSRFYNVDPYSDQILGSEPNEIVRDNDIEALLSTIGVYTVFFLNTKLDIIGISKVSDAPNDLIMNFSNFRETTIGTSAAVLIGEPTQVAYTTRYEHYHQALHEYDTVCIPLLADEDSCSQHKPADVFAVLFLCKTFSEVMLHVDVLRQKYSKIFNDSDIYNRSTLLCLENHESKEYTQKNENLSVVLKLQIKPLLTYKVIIKIAALILNKYNWITVHIPAVKDSAEVLEKLIPTIIGKSTLLLLTLDGDTIEPEISDSLMGIPILILENQTRDFYKTGDFSENTDWCEQLEVDGYLKSVDLFMKSFINSVNLGKDNHTEKIVEECEKNSIPTEVPTLERTTQQRVVTSSLKEVERNAIIAALIQAHGSKTAAAVVLEISRTTLYRKIQEYDIDITEYK